MSNLVEVFKGVFRKIVRVDGAKKPLGSGSTTVAPWISVPIYDPLGGEVILGLDGPERVQLAADCKIYPPLCTGGYPPQKQKTLLPDNNFEVIEIPVAAPTNLGTAGKYTKGVIIKPAAAQFIRSQTVPATAQDIVIPFEFFEVRAVQAGIASCWAICSTYTNTTENVTAR